MLEQGLKAQPENAPGYYVLAWLYLQKGEQDKATVAFSKTVQLAPASKEGHEAQAALERLKASGRFRAIWV